MPENPREHYRAGSGRIRIAYSHRSKAAANANAGIRTRKWRQRCCFASRTELVHKWRLGSTRFRQKIDFGGFLRLVASRAGADELCWNTAEIASSQIGRLHAR